MNAPVRPLPTAAARDTGLERKLENALEGEVRFDAFTRGRYATDASIYQIVPEGVVFPRTVADLRAVLEIAAEAGTAVIARGAGTSQNGQPIGPGLVVDCSRHLGALLALDPERGAATVEPGVVLDHLNARLRAEGWFFPVEPSTASRCTIGGMIGNNSSGARSLRYGKMVDNVLGIDALLASGEPFRFGPITNDEGGVGLSTRARRMADAALAIAEAERAEIEARFPKVQRRVGGYNLDALIAPAPNLAHLLVGSEGTLAVTTRAELKLARLPAHRVMGVCHFPSFRKAMETTQHLVALGPTAVELVDNNVLVLGADIPLFRATLADITRGTPDCLLLVEFAGDERSALDRDLDRLDECMADHGFPGAVVKVAEPARQRSVWEVREACLNIMTSMKGDGKPVSFIEDCAVPLDKLADYTSAITELFARHGTRGTWYAHASVGCLHVRPILNMKTEQGVRAMRAIAEEAAELVRRFEGSFSGEHGDGISRSEFIEPMFGARLTRAFERVKDAFDPANRLNPGKITRPWRMDDRALMRFPPGYAAAEPARPALDWSEWGGFGGAVEMCNNNGACRKTAGGAMCPSYRATREEKDVTRGRANTLRLAVSGQLPGGLASDGVKDALGLCVSCKACRRECPTGVDMARMKIEFLNERRALHGLSLRSKLVAHLPRYAPFAGLAGPVLNARNWLPGLAFLGERLTGFTARRSLPKWRRPWREPGAPARPDEVRGDGRDLVLFADTFNRAFEPKNLQAAQRVLAAFGYRLHYPAPAEGVRPLCCGRTYLAAGMVDEAKAEINRTVRTLAPFVRAGARVVGLEPSCLLGFRDEFGALFPGDAEVGIVSTNAHLFEEVVVGDADTGRRCPPLRAGRRVAHLHGHCHQKSFGVMGPVEAALRLVPGLEVRPIESSCCGGAGAFGYEREHVDVSLAMGELSLFPAVRAAGPGDLVVADGTSCRHQIKDGTGREAVHVARVLEGALAG
jgi:FAD/FMN-containing dehydrogenase/Fe-S oxidoreductase